MTVLYTAESDMVKTCNLVNIVGEYGPHLLFRKVAVRSLCPGVMMLVTAVLLSVVKSLFLVRNKWHTNLRISTSSTFIWRRFWNLNIVCARTHIHIKSAELSWKNQFAVCLCVSRLVYLKHLNSLLRTPFLWHLTEGFLW